MEAQPPASAQRGTAASAALAPAAGLVAGQVAVIGVLVMIAGVAWLATGLRMAGMDAGPGTDPGAFGFYISTWVVMMAAMMFPSIVPVATTHRELHRRTNGHGGRIWASTLFVIGYLAIWGAAGAVAYAVLEVGRSVDGGFLAWHRAGRWAAAGVLLLAAAYELTARKNACLTRCRTPRGFLLERWRDGYDGAVRMGVQHGFWCLGCCWGLMAALFAVGAMSLVWMALISVLVAAEKLLPWRAIATVGVASVLATVAIGVAAAPARVPALTIPGGPKEMRAMGMMRKPNSSRIAMPNSKRMAPGTARMPR
jgi:predicted metal-binding membrane protein